MKCRFPASKQILQLLKIFLEKHWSSYLEIQNLFKKCSFFAKKVACYTFSVLLLIPWITVPGLIKHTGWILFSYKIQAFVCTHCTLRSCKASFANSIGIFITNLPLSLITFLLTVNHASSVQIRVFFGPALNLWFNIFPQLFYRHCWHWKFSTDPISNIFSMLHMCFARSL
jgi:hypothetical protein